MSLVTSVLTETGQTLVELPFPPIIFGMIAVAIFAACGLVMFTYRDVSRRHSHKTDAQATHGAHGSHSPHDAIKGGSGH